MKINKEKISKFNEIILKNKIIILVSIILIVAVSITFSLILKSLNNKQDASIYSAFKQVTSPYPLADEITIELGSKLPEYYVYFRGNDLPILNNPSIKYYLNNKEISINEFSENIDYINYSSSTNKYQVIIDNKYTSTLNIIDTTKPIISLKDLTITEGDLYDARSFVGKYNDNSGDSDFTASFKYSGDSVLKTAGLHEVTISVCDSSNNCTEDKTNLIIKTNDMPNNNPVVQTITQAKLLSSESLNYGVKKNTYVDITYNVHLDFSKVEESRGETYTKIIYDEYNGTTDTIRSEASEGYYSNADLRKSVLDITNSYRQEKDINELKEERDLSIMATIRAIELAHSNIFEHKRPDDRDWETIWTEFDNRKYEVIGENLARETDSPNLVCEAWKESHDHYANMTNAEFTKIGIGVYTFEGETYWVQLFEN